MESGRFLTNDPKVNLSVGYYQILIIYKLTRQDTMELIKMSNTINKWA